MKQITDALYDSLIEYFDNKADADGKITGGFTPNKEMKLLSRLQESQEIKIQVMDKIEEFYPYANGNDNAAIEWNNRANVARAAFIKGYSLKADCLQWVKASERLPDERGIYFVKQFNKLHGIEDGIYKGSRIYDPIYKWEPSFEDRFLNYEVIEWLDESLESSSKITELEKEVERRNKLIEKLYRNKVGSTYEGWEEFKLTNQL